MTKQLKSIINKIYKSGLYHSINVEESYIGFKNTNGVLFTFQNIDNSGIGIFTAGYVNSWVDRDLTYESEYSVMGNIEKSKYSIFYTQSTDNPDFILRAANSITLNR